MDVDFPSVREIFARRAADRLSEPGRRRDPWKLAVVAEGGAMRGVVTAALLARLEEHGLDRCVDMWGGTSSGGMAAAYAAAGRVRLGASIYADELGPRGYLRDGASPRFIDPKRLVTGGAAMDVQGLVDYVFKHLKPLAYENLRSSAAEVFVTASGRHGQLHVHELQGKSPAEVAAALKDTARIPLLAHNPRDTAVLWDGALTGHNIPVELAKARGATHVLVVRAFDAQHDALGVVDSLEKYLLGPALRLLAADLAYALKRRRMKAYQVARELGRVDVGVLSVSVGHDVVSGEQDVGKMWRAAAAAWDEMGRALGLEPAKLPPEWRNGLVYL